MGTRTGRLAGVRVPLSAAAPLVAAITWAIALMIDTSPLGTTPAMLTAASMLVMSAVAVVGMVVAGARWAWLLGLGSSAVSAVVAAVRPSDVAWMIGIAATTISVFALLSPGVSRTIRKRPSAAGPPPRVVAVPLLALMAPALLGLTGTGATPWALLVVGLTGPVAAFMYSRVLPGGLLAVRVVWPGLALGLSPFLGPLCGGAAVALAVAIVVLAWHPLVKTAYHPPLERGTTFPIPPELTPSEVRDAAEIDESGRPR